MRTEKKKRKVYARLAIAAAAGLACCGLFPQCLARTASQQAPPQLTNDEAQSLVKRVLQTELNATEDASHPMQYRLRKTSPRLSTTKMIVETKDGDVAHLVAINGVPLSSQDQQNENARLQGLLNDPNLQRHRQQGEQRDSERVRKIIQALPNAFLYAYSGIVQAPQGPSYRLTFQPNPAFDPQDPEAVLLKGMAGELWIDVAQQRVTRLQGKRIKDVDYGLGIVGKLAQGGTLLLEQADIGNRQWRTTRMVLVMDCRLFLFKSIKLDTTLELSQFTPVAVGMDYRQAIKLLQLQAPTQQISMLKPAKQ